MKSPENEPSLPQKTHTALPGVGKASLTLALLFAGTTKAQHPAEPQPVGVNGVAVPGTVQFPTRVFAQDPVAPFVIPPLPERNPIAGPQLFGVGPFGHRYPLPKGPVFVPPLPKAGESINAKGHYAVRFIALNQCNDFYDQIRTWHETLSDDASLQILLHAFTNDRTSLEQTLRPSSGTDLTGHIPYYDAARENAYTRGLMLHQATTRLKNAGAFDAAILLANTGMADEHFFVQLHAAMLAKALETELGKSKKEENARFVPEDSRRSIAALQSRADEIFREIDQRSITVDDAQAFDLTVPEIDENGELNLASLPMHMLQFFGPQEDDIRRRLRHTFARRWLFGGSVTAALRHFDVGDSPVPEVTELMNGEENIPPERIRNSLRMVMEKDPSLKRRIAAASLLLRVAEGREEEATQFLLEELRQATPDDEERRVTAGFFVEELGENVDFGTSQIVKSLDAEEDHVRGIALEALGNLRDSQQAKVIMLWLERSLRDKNFRVRDEAAKSLQKLGNRFPMYWTENFDASLDRYKKEREAEVARIKAERATKGR